MDGIQNSINGIRNSMDGIQNSINGIRNSMDGIQNSINGIRNSMDGMENAINGIRNSIDKIKNTIVTGALLNEEGLALSEQTYLWRAQGKYSKDNSNKIKVEFLLIRNEHLNT
ncbi:hypothetical protein O181_050272 [Austropuccinia psidii MF-1]|uniref:Uncharacterized protein n=1 Tax=Austropuccinia psidii MF-1 TaxID=1389203 RepID=A0A9Q3E3B8_9BASI|nr:hypothetical protein [Austropuccinia psidii MF-1]